jgi:membrane protein
MKTSCRKTLIAVTAAVALAAARAGLPALLTWLANAAVRRVPGVRGRIRRVEINFIAPGIAAEDISLMMLNGGASAHKIEIGALVVNSAWKALLTGSLIASLHIDTPRLLFNTNGINFTNGNKGKRGIGQDDGNDKPRELCGKAGQPWQEKLAQLPRFKVTSAILTDGEVRVAGLPGEKGTEIFVDRLNLHAENITNSIELADTMMASLSVDACLLSSGKFHLQAQGYPLAESLTFNADLSCSDVDLTELRGVIETAVEIDVRRGVLDFYLEAAAADGYIDGYAKPIFDHLELEPPIHSGFVARVKAWAAKALTWLGRNKRKDRIATRLDFEGAVDAPDLDITDAVLRFISNAFRTAQRASFDYGIWFSRAGKTADEVTIYDTGKPRSRTAAVFALVKEAFSRWSEHSAPRMAAALSYYTAFSMAPVLILAISIAGLVFGHDAAQGKIVEQIGGLVGTKSAAAIQSMLQAANRPFRSVMAGIIGIISLIAGAIWVLSELKNALNTIWRAKERDDIKKIIINNVLFVGMLLGIGFLLAVSLVLDAALASVGKFLYGLLPASAIILQGINFVLAVGIAALLFAAMYRFLPNTRIEWHDVWIGAAVTSLLFNLGKLALGLYIGKSAIASSYGAAGAVLVLLLWVYYSGLIFYFGAEFTKVYADRYGSRLQAKRIAPSERDFPATNSRG